MNHALDDFFAQYFARHPVNATFTGVHAHDGRLPDWSKAGRAADVTEMRALRSSLTTAYAGNAGVGAMQGDATLLDAELALANLDVRIAEHESGFMHARNPALWTGEAIFGAVSLMLRPFAPRVQRLEPLAVRLGAIPAFLVTMRETLARDVPACWSARARRECLAAEHLFGPGLDTWLAEEPCDPASATRIRAVAAGARAAFRECEAWLAALPAADETACSAGSELFEVLLRRGHFFEGASEDLLRAAAGALGPAQARLASLARDAGGSWNAAEAALAADAPTVEDYYGAFQRTWDACRAFSLQHDVVTWPDWPIRYVPIPDWAREAAPQLYWLHYRSPAPMDAYTVHDYAVTPVDAACTSEEQGRRLRAWNHGTITLNHVVHHGALGHHVQNWHAAHRSRSRVGRIAAVDCASRIGMFLGGSLAEGWACYATELMDELGFLTPLQRVAEQHSRVRMLARAIVDIRLHTQGMPFDGAVQFYVTEAAMSRDAAAAEVTKNSMFPCTALMYWLGTQGILDLRGEMRRRRGASFTLRSFHDEVLGFGAIPVPLIARLMAGSGA